jgi:hypothetical protein
VHSYTRGLKCTKIHVQVIPKRKWNNFDLNESLYSLRWTFCQKLLWNFGNWQYSSPFFSLNLIRARVAQWVRKLDYLTTHTMLSPIQRGFAPGFVNYKKGCTRLAAASDKVYQLLAHGRWFSPGTPLIRFKETLKLIEPVIGWLI